ncbi:MULTISPECIES: DUF1499 domain-containing protein [unclassified Sulfitobacter]|jgi:hypothetical protein|uniref:DUF1499 domain-containing protein n=1 Tax=unclassified Sulfitobacter TaxID=196795 RepID=UPI0008374F2B|nr:MULTISPECIES: DUF1499 domain-containing protein [unclassified Sulfitobacter]
MGWIIWAMLGIALAIALYVRFAPSDVAYWHRPVTAGADADGEGSAVRILQGGSDLMARLDREMRALPRTRVLSGSPEAGRVTYVTRSRVMGFPDYTTLERRPDGVALYGRLRFGRSDFGVNAARLDRVIGQVEAR